MMRGGQVVLMTDHSSTDGSTQHLAIAVERVTGLRPALVDARYFMTGGTGQATISDGRLELRVPAEGFAAVPTALIVYEIPPGERRRFRPFQHLLARSRTRTLGADADAWEAATEKDLTVARFARDSIAQMPTITLRRPSSRQAAQAFEQLDRDVWARPTVGMGGDGVFHITTSPQLREATRYYATTGQTWLMARDAGNLTPDGQRQQYRVVVLHDRVVRVCEHRQPDPDAPGNESRGATSDVLHPDDLRPDLADLAIAATKSLGLPFGGVDLAPTDNGTQRGVVFEVNVHPTITPDTALESVVIPYVQAHWA